MNWFIPFMFIHLLLIAALNAVDIIDKIKHRKIIQQHISMRSLFEDN